MIISQAEVVTVLEDMIKARLVITSQPFTPKRKVVAQSVAAAAWDSLLPGRGAHGSSSSTTANTTTETAAVVVKKRSRKNMYNVQTSLYCLSLSHVFCIHSIEQFLMMMARI